MIFKQKKYVSITIIKIENKISINVTSLFIDNFTLYSDYVIVEFKSEKLI